ncbi:MAG: DUF4238 domain-containing protein [Caldilineaceae bacterium]
MKTKSTRHHFLPKFLINGFTNSEGFVWIYDKEKDEIIPNPRPPKSIFWEKNRNTVKINEEENTSLIEDEFYLKLDNESAKLLRNFQEDKITEELLSSENQANFQFFLINLFWRIPLTNFAAKDIIQRAKISVEGIDAEILRNDEEFHKIKRFGLYNHTIDQIVGNKPSKADYFVKMLEFASDIFVLGDYPILFRSTPKTFADLGYLDYLFAVSSTRIYIYSFVEFGDFTRKTAYNFNAHIIDQSVKHVVSGNQKVLKESVLYYKELKKANLLLPIKEMMFNK